MGAHLQILIINHRAKRAASDDAGPPSTKPRRSKAADHPTKTVFSHDLRPPPFTGPQLRVLSWNVAGLRALLKKHPDALQNLVSTQQADVLCIQEHKLQTQHVQEVQATLADVLPGWTSTFACCTADGRKGQSGVAILCRKGYGRKPCHHCPRRIVFVSHRVAPLAPPHPPQGPLASDDEGRVLVAEFPLFFLVCAYVPNSGKVRPCLLMTVKSRSRCFGPWQAVEGQPGSGLKRLVYRTNAADGWDGKLAATLKVGVSTNCISPTTSYHQLLLTTNSFTSPTQCVGAGGKR